MNLYGVILDEAIRLGKEGCNLKIDIWGIVRIGLEAHPVEVPELTRQNYRLVIKCVEWHSHPHADWGARAIRLAAEYDGIGYSGNPRWYTISNRATLAAEAAHAAAQLHALRESLHDSPASRAAYAAAAERMIALAVTAGRA